MPKMNKYLTNHGWAISAQPGKVRQFDVIRITTIAAFDGVGAEAFGLYVVMDVNENEHSMTLIKCPNQRILPRNADAP